MGVTVMQPGGRRRSACRLAALDDPFFTVSGPLDWACRCAWFIRRLAPRAVAPLTPQEIQIPSPFLTSAGSHLSVTPGLRVCRDPAKMSSGPPSCHLRCHSCRYLSSAAWRGVAGCDPLAAPHHQVVPHERACGEQLANRGPHPGGTAILTPLGRQLCQQARDNLGIRPGPGAP